jgi:hypothetical protein
MSDKYSDQIPIVDRGSQRLKIARLAAGLAARTFSHGDISDSIGGYSTIRVRKCHVEYIEDFLYEQYDGPGLNYLTYSQAQHKQYEMSSVDEVRTEILALTCADDFITLMSNANAIDLNDLMDWGSMSHEVAQDRLSMLVRTRSLIRKGRLYFKSPAFSALLRELEEMTPEQRKQLLPGKKAEY